ncbi:MAG: hypothetical protein MJY99_02200 [Fibrobacter sp.]|nr:hypothetical protein [Fibrobacter sp.]
MNKSLTCVIIFLSLFLVSCAEDEGWNASDVCPEAGTNRYGMPNRGTFVDERDGREYKYTTIGDQVWMAENLKYELPYPYSMCYGQMTCKEEWWGDTTCTRDTAYLAEIAQKMQSACTDNDCIAKEYCETFGRYYSLMENGGQMGLLDRGVVDSVCPNGWHVPTKDDWDLLLENVDGETSVLKSANVEYFEREKHVGTDECAFNSIPVGDLYTSGSFFRFFSEKNSYWTQTQMNTINALTVDIEYPTAEYSYGHYKNAIRCVKN